MPVYPYRCQDSSCGAVYERRRTVQARNRCPKCPECGSRTARTYAVFGISESYLGQTMYEKERNDWALATGERHGTFKDLEQWATSRGKAIVGKDWKPKPAEDPVSDREIEKALEKHAAEYHVDDNPDGTLNEEGYQKVVTEAKHE